MNDWYFLADNEKEAFDWWLLAAKSGDALAQYLVGFCYESGIGTKRNMSQALRWYLLASESSLLEAQISLGFIYEEGIGVDVNKIEAYKWFKMAADQGDAIAKFHLASLCEDSASVFYDLKKAIGLYHSSASEGYAPSQYKLAVLIDRGELVKKSLRAIKWYQLAADQGLCVAQHALGAIYENGRGVVADYTAALSWYKKAAACGHDESATAYKLLEKKLSLETPEIIIGDKIDLQMQESVQRSYPNKIFEERIKRIIRKSLETIGKPFFR